MASEVLEQLRGMYRQIKEQNEAHPLSDQELAARLPPMRTQSDEMIKQSMPIPEGITVEEKVIGGRWGEYYRVDETIPDKKKNSLILYIHGGGWENGSVVSRRFVTMTLAQMTKTDCFSVDYTQWPEGRFDQGLAECLSVYSTFLGMGYESKNITLAGESAGGSMVLSMALKLKEEGKPLPGHVVAYSPVTDLEDHFPSRQTLDALDPMISANVGRTMLRHYCDGQGAHDPIRCACYGNFDGFPPTFIGVGSDEVLLDDSVDLAEKLKAAGVRHELRIYDGLYHTFMLIPAPESFECLKQTAAFIAE